MTKTLPAMLVLSLGACSSLGSSLGFVPVTSVATAQQDFNQAVSDYAAAKNVAQLLALADPAVSAVVTPAIAKIDPIVAGIVAQETTVATDASAIEALVTSLEAQVTALKSTATTPKSST